MNVSMNYQRLLDRMIIILMKSKEKKRKYIKETTEDIYK